MSDLPAALKAMHGVRAQLDCVQLRAYWETGHGIVVVQVDDNGGQRISVDGQEVPLEGAA